uniref:CRS2-associated factor 1, chloroplastic n=1 Tax=Lygus hesperus TaxID=30085 RepID=A0A0A9WDV9_LYGHE
MEEGKLQLALVVTLVLLIALAEAQNPPMPSNQVFISGELEPQSPVIIYKVRHYQGQRWKNVLIPPGRDPNILTDVVPDSQIPEEDLPEEEPVRPDDVERK